MPVITVTLMQGYDEATRQTLSERLTDAVTETIAAPLDGVTVIIQEVPAANYMRGRRSRVPGAAKNTPT
jgi:4-oxalocrotonate tautomerase family enzyme